MNDNRTSKQRVVQCGVCQRTGFDRAEFAQPCGTLKPDGSRCTGQMHHWPAKTTITFEELTELRRRADETSGDVEKERMRAALKLIAEPSCERLTSGPGSCWSEPTWSPEAQYGADKWCDACIALSALMPAAAAKRLPLEPTPERTATGGVPVIAGGDPDWDIAGRGG